MQNFSNDLPPFQQLDPLSQIKQTLKVENTGSKAFIDAIQLLIQMGNQDNFEAKLLLARVFVQKGSIENASQLALNLFSEVANKTGHPEAIEGIADLLLWGVGVDKDEVKSFKLYKKLAKMGFIPMTLLAYFYTNGIGVEENQNLASNLILKSASQGDTLAFILLAHRFTMGYGVPIEPTLAAAFATLACKRQFPGAESKLKAIHEKFDSIDERQLEEMVIKLIQHIESLADDVEQLARKIPQQDPRFIVEYLSLLEQNQIKLGIRALSFNSEKRGYKFQCKPNTSLNKIIHSESPTIISIDNFISFEECQYLINQSLPILQATAEQVALNPNSEIDAFSGSSAILSAMYSSPVSRVVQQRFADIVRTPVSHFEPVSVLKYSVGDEYSLHTDAFNLNRIKNHEQGGDFGGQRVTTNLIYLLPALEGGETEYPTPKISIKGKVGMAIIHSNSKPNFEEDENSFHIGKPIVSGEKWILRTAVRQFQLYANNKISLNAD